MINTILVTDDNVLDNAILKNYLYKERFNVISALNGREALDQLEIRNIDLVILDLVMPVMDGFQFLKQFSKTKLYNEIPIIIASSLVDPKNLEQIFKYNIYDYVIKPLDHINRLIMVNKIKNALEFRKMLLDLKKNIAVVEEK